MTDELLRDIAAWRKEWLEQNDPQDGTDCVTPFDKYLYGNSAAPAGPVPSEAPASPARDIKPMPAKEMAQLKAVIAKRWDEKPWYDGVTGFGSPGCMMRAHEILALIAAAEKGGSQKGTTRGHLGLIGYIFWDGDDPKGFDDAFFVWGKEDPAHKPGSRGDHQGHMWKSSPVYSEVHSLLAGAASAGAASHDEALQNTDGWHSHDGMLDPEIPGDTLVQVCFRDGDMAFGLVHDWDQNWQWADSEEGIKAAGAIIAWRRHPSPSSNSMAVPKGWKLVPDEPTAFMIASAISVDWRRGEDTVRRIWQKMLADAPPPPVRSAGA